MTQKKDALNKKIPIIAIVGPTATGKSKLAIEIAKLIQSEIISCDSMQIYKNMDIGTAKPTKKEQQDIVHHMLDFLDLSKDFSVADYCKQVHKIIASMINKNKIPIVAGGTGLYLKALLDNINFSDIKVDQNLRNELNKKANTVGIQPLIDELSTFDKQYLNSLKEKNGRRIIRAIEIYRTTGITMTQHIEKSRKAKALYDPCLIGLNFKDRALLYDRIEQRVDRMIEQGLLKEAEYILNLNCSKNAKNAIAYKELLPYIKGDCELKTAINKLKQSSRNYAKRQITWFKRDNRINWIYLDYTKNFDEVVEKSKLILKNRLNLQFS